MLESAISLSDNHSCWNILNSEQDWLGEGGSLQVGVLPGCIDHFDNMTILKPFVETVICVWKLDIGPLRLDYFSAWIICLNVFFYCCFNRLKLPLFVSLLYNASPCVLPYSPSLTDKTHCASGQTSNASKSMRDAFWKKIFNSQRQQVF